MHICCAPCAIYPLEQLSAGDCEVMGFFYRHNIHPYTECLKRQATLQAYAATVRLQVIYQKGYALEHFLRTMAFRESERCAFCYHDRLQATAQVAKRGKFDAFTTTLLYSKFQQHERIKAIAEQVGHTTGVPFYYQDFRTGWKAGIAQSKRLGLYRQQYCGCIYSEKDRYYPSTGARPDGRSAPQSG